MDLVTIGIWLALGLVALGVLAIVLFGLKNMAAGKFRPFTLVAMLIPVVVFAIAYALSAGGPDPLAAAMVLTALILLVIGALAILFTGLKGLVGL